MVDACGLCARQAKIDFWRHERMPLPLDYLSDECLVEDLRSALDKSEKVAEALASALRRFAATILAPTGTRPDWDAVRDCIRHLGTNSALWSRLETPFYRLLSDLPEDREGSLDTWLATLRRTAWDAFDEATHDLDRSPRTLRAVVEARQSLSMGLGRALK